MADMADMVAITSTLLAIEDCVNPSERSERGKQKRQIKCAYKQVSNRLVIQLSATPIIPATTQDFRMVLQTLSTVRGWHRGDGMADGEIWRLE